MNARKLRKRLRKAGRKIARIAKVTFAPYVIVDSYGTVQCEWTLAGAMSWLPVTSPHTMIWHRWHGALVASRVMSESVTGE